MGVPLTLTLTLALTLALTIWKDEDGCMAESLDIIAKLDPTGSIKPASGRTDFKAWQKSEPSPYP